MKTVTCTVFESVKEISRPGDSKFGKLMGRGRERTAVWFGVFPGLHGKSAFELGVLSPAKGLLAMSGDVSGCRDRGGQGATGM